jgi:hypothetical protein
MKGEGCSEESGKDRIAKFQGYIPYMEFRFPHVPNSEICPHLFYSDRFRRTIVMSSYSPPSWKSFNSP